MEQVRGVDAEIALKIANNLLEIMKGEWAVECGHIYCQKSLDNALRAFEMGLENVPLSKIKFGREYLNATYNARKQILTKQEQFRYEHAINHYDRIYAERVNNSFQYQRHL